MMTVRLVMVILKFNTLTNPAIPDPLFSSFSKVAELLHLNRVKISKGLHKCKRNSIYQSMLKGVPFC